MKTTGVNIARNKFQICKQLGEGAFGKIYQGIHTKTNEEIAIKLEKHETDIIYPNLQYESKILQKLQPHPGVPRFIWSGLEGEYNILVMQILGPSLDALFEFCEYKFEMKTILWIASQAITLVENMHDLGYLHRDLKPENLVIG